MMTSAATVCGLGMSLLLCFSTAQAVLVFDPPNVTEVFPALTSPANRISGAVPEPSMGDVHWKTTTYPCSTLTTWTSTSKESTVTLTFSPTSKSTMETTTKGGSTLPPSASTCSAVTVTSSVTTTATATSTKTSVSTTTATSTETSITTSTQTSISTTTTTSTATSVTTTTATATTTKISTATATATTTATTTETISSCSITSAPASPTFSCAPEGFLIQTAALYEVDLTTGTVDTIKNPVAPGSATINAIGFNVLDNFIYGYRLDAPNQGIVRLAADGSYLAIAADATPGSSNLGDFGGSGDLWISQGGTNYFVYDLAPNSPTYGTLLSNGATTGGSGLSFADWVYIPIMGNYLYSMGLDTASGVSVLARFSMTTFAWEVVETYTTAIGGFGALFGINNGTIIGSDNASGKIWNIPLDGTAPFVISQGPTSSGNDGARCVNNMAI